MISSLQPPRPKVTQTSRPTTPACPSAASNFLPLGHQQIRHEHAALLQMRPRSQIEAMPPFAPLSQHPIALTVPPRGLLQNVTSTQTPQYDSAMRHPVFFTDKWRKPSLQGLDGGGGGGIFNPVAQGYMFEGGSRIKADQQTRTKL